MPTLQRVLLCWSECPKSKSPRHLNYRPYRVLHRTPAHTASFYGQLPALKVSTTVLESLLLLMCTFTTSRDEESHLNNVLVLFHLHLRRANVCISHVVQTLLAQVPAVLHMEDSSGRRLVRTCVETYLRNI